MMDFLAEFLSRPDVQKYLVLIGIALLGMLADALHDVVKGIEVTGAGKSGVKGQRSMLRPWSRALIAITRIVVEGQTGRLKEKLEKMGGREK